MVSVGSPEPGPTTGGRRPEPATALIGGREAESDRRRETVFPQQIQCIAEIIEPPDPIQSDLSEWEREACQSVRTVLGLPMPVDGRKAIP
jgi:hypothetical protein